MRVVALSTTIAAAAAIASSGAAQKSSSAQKSTAKSSTAVASASDGQTIRVGKTVVARPFGAELVDRLALAGSYGLRGRRVHLIRGDAAGPCPSRFVFVSEQPSAGPVTSAPFGTCSGAAQARVSGKTLTVTMPDAPGAATSTQYSFDGGQVRTLNAVASSIADCVPAAQVDSVAQAAAITVFESEYPLAYRNRGSLKKTTIKTDEMRELVATMACLAPWSAAERRISKIATPLFASRHGPAAFAALAGIAEDPTSDAHLRASARSFAAEMIYRVERRAQS